MTQSTKAKIVNVEVEEGTSGAFFATSPELPGLHVARMTKEELLGEVPHAIATIYAAGGVDVFVSPVEDSETDRRWVAIPADAEKVRSPST